jgi:hypothetical protein
MNLILTLFTDKATISKQEAQLLTSPQQPLDGGTLFGVGNFAVWPADESCLQNMPLGNRHFPAAASGQ